MKIVCATDFAPHARSVAKAAIELARRTGGSVELVHVIDPPSAHVQAPSVDVDVLERALWQCVEAKLAVEAQEHFALLAYVERNDLHDRQLQTIRRTVRDSCRVATCVGFGPRFLHSTGQAYKGGPPNGVFLQLTCDDAQDLQITGHRFSFGVVKAAQALGDFRVLVQRDRRALRIHLGADVRSGLDALSKAIERALPTKQS